MADQNDAKKQTQKPPQINHVLVLRRKKKKKKKKALSASQDIYTLIRTLNIVVFLIANYCGSALMDGVWLWLFKLLT